MKKADSNSAASLVAEDVPLRFAAMLAVYDVWVASQDVVVSPA